MPELQPWAGAQAYPLHVSWMSHWLSDLKAANLRKEIWKSHRFSDRIIEDLLGAQSELLGGPAQAAKIEMVIQAASRPDILRRIGLCWMAPVLAGYLLNARTREICGALSKDEMQYVLDSRNHTSIDLIEPIVAGCHPARQGNICLAAWLSALDVEIADRVKLLLPALDPVHFDQDDAQFSARVALIWSIFGAGL